MSPHSSRVPLVLSLALAFRPGQRGPDLLNQAPYFGRLINPYDTVAREKMHRIRSMGSPIVDDQGEQRVGVGERYHFPRPLCGPVQHPLRIRRCQWHAVIIDAACLRGQPPPITAREIGLADCWTGPARPDLRAHPASAPYERTRRVRARAGAASVGLAVLVWV